MSSIVIELQKDSLNPEISATQLLRKALVVANKLGIEDLIDWITKELNGYNNDDKLPEYREVGGEVMVFNPYHGWQPVLFRTKRETEIMSSKYIMSSISKIENICKKKDDDSVITYNIPDEIRNRIMRATAGLVPSFVANESQINGIIEAVKNIILNWSLKLEKEGILGEDLYFSDIEKEKVTSKTFNIENFTGVIGDISGGDIQIGDYNSIHKYLKKLGVPQIERNQLEEIMDNLGNKDCDEKQSWYKKGLDWLKRNGSTIGVWSENIRGWLELMK